jgi:hypothetical protein
LIAITPPSKNSVQAAVNHVGKDDLVWTWIGEGPMGDFDLAPSGRKLDIQPYIKKLSLELREAYIDYVGEIGRQSSSDWWRTSVSEKNPYISQTFFHICCVKACLDAVGQSHRNSPYVLIVQNPVLRKVIGENLKRAGYEVRLFETETPSSFAAIRRLAGILVYQAYFIIKNTSKIFHARYRHRLHESKPIQALRSSGVPVCIANIWIDLRAYSAETGEFHDVDFSGVAAYLRSQGKTVAGLANIQNAASYEKVTQYIARSNSVFLVPHSFLKIGDVFSSVWHSLIAVPQHRNFQPFAGLVIGDLVFNDLQEEWYTQRETDHILIERWVERLKESGIRVERFIYTFENHTWERVICNALKAAYPAVRLIGYQPNGLPLLLLNYFISEAESDSIPLPHRIVANGEYPERLLKDSNFGKDRVVLGGGLRQSYLQGLLYGASPAHPPATRSAQILVTPSIGRYRSVELIHKVVEAFKGMPDVSLIIKCHPSMRFDQIQPFLGRLKIPGNTRISTQPILELLPDVSVLVYNDGTFPAAEALAFGIPVVFVEPEYGLCLDSLDGFPHARRTTRTADDIATTVIDLLGSRNFERSETEGLNVVRQLVGKVTEDTLQLFAD